jgi:putative phosphoribosyl transferase
MGAVGEGGVRIVDGEVVRMAGVTDDELARVERRERLELERRVRRFRGDRAGIPLEGRVAVIVDDGIATGSTARTACQVVRARGAARVVLAVPVAPPGWVDRLAGLADDCVCLSTPAPFFAVGQFYDDFSQTTDEQVVACLRDRGRSPATTAAAVGDDPADYDGEVTVTAGSAELRGHLTVPERPVGMVVFAHGSGSSRHSPRNRSVASVLNGAGLGTLLLDLLTPAEERDRARVFDIDLLAGRLLAATGWVRSRAEAAGLRVGYFGASTGAAAALRAAAEPGGDIAAVVSRGGRPDLAGPRLPDVTAPTLLVVGGDDDAVLELNRRAQAQLRCANRLVIVPGATHLFEEPGALPAVAEAARAWFTAHLAPVQAGRGGP